MYIETVQCSSGVLCCVCGCFGSLSDMMTALLLSLSVAENLVHRGKFCVDTGSDVVVDVLPLYEFELRKFQVRFHHTLVSEISLSADGAFV